MRLLFWVLCFALCVALVWFAVSNAGTEASVKVGSTVFSDVPISLLVGVSVVFGVIVTAIVAIAEGARSRFENRRLTRELRQLETEIHYLRTQPPAAAQPESGSPEQLPTIAPRREESPGSPGSPESPASAPVYGDDEEDWTDPEMYRGGTTES